MAEKLEALHPERPLLPLTRTHKMKINHLFISQGFSQIWTEPADAPNSKFSPDRMISKIQMLLPILVIKS